ncbi:MAG: hypothetical protein NT126_09500 [Bacteroidetes bacterium]|nr:hypothetical protein [Bacteroidota bacterium]
MKRASLFCFLILLLAASSCKLFRKGGDKKNAIARVYDLYLFPEDLVGIVPAGSSRQDSITATKNFIQNWIRRKVVLRKAEDNLDNEKKDVEKQLEEYRNSLVTYAYEKALIEQKLDTNISQKEIEDFYLNNQNNFELKDNIIKVIYLKLNKKSPKIERAKQWYKSDIKKDRALLTDYCHQYALNYYLDDNVWLQFDDLLKEIPIKTYDKEQFLQNNRNIEMEDSLNIYLVSIKGFKIKNSVSPLSFEENNIRTMILNQRKLKLIDQMEQQAFEHAKKNNDFEVY